MKAVKIQNEQEYNKLMEAYDKVGWEHLYKKKFKYAGEFAVLFQNDYILIKRPSDLEGMEEISVEQALEILEVQSILGADTRDKYTLQELLNKIQVIDEETGEELALLVFNEYKHGQDSLKVSILDENISINKPTLRFKLK